MMNATNEIIQNGVIALNHIQCIVHTNLFLVLQPIKIKSYQNIFLLFVVCYDFFKMLSYFTGRKYRVEKFSEIERLLNIAKFYG